MSGIFESGRLLLRQTGQLRGKTFLQITVVLGLNGENLWRLKSEEFSFFKDHLDFWHELGKFVSDFGDELREN